MITRYQNPIVICVSQILIPFIQLFALYVLFNGHHSPGGGFQAGVLIGASFILKLLLDAYNPKKLISLLNETLLSTLGLFIYALIGILALIHGADFLDYGALSFFSETIAQRRYWGILGIELGVTIVVAMTLVIIFHALALVPEEKEPSL